jgi:hypothetical protein
MHDLVLLCGRTRGLVRLSSARLFLGRTSRVWRRAPLSKSEIGCSSLPRPAMNQTERDRRKALVPPTSVTRFRGCFRSTAAGTAL